MNPHRIDLVCFDIGNVLIELSSGWPQACAEADVALPAIAGDRAIIERLEALNREHECGRIDAATHDSRAAAFTGLSSDQIDSVSRAWVRAPFPGVTDLLSRVANSRTKTACLSNTNDRHWSMFHGKTPNRSVLPIHLLDHPMASHRIGIMKPDAGIFDHAEKTTGVAGDQILFFDDNDENCAAAAQRGWCVQRIDPRGDPAAQMEVTLTNAGVIEGGKP